VARSRTPRTAKRVDGYVRVSRVGGRDGDSFISPSVQREAIEEWTARQGFRLLEVFEELDESGSRPDRPLLEQAIARIESGGSSGLVVWRVDRFGRSLADGVRTIERIRAAGGTFFSVADGLDISTDAGRLVLRILLSVAEYQLDGIRASWNQAAERAIRRGIHMGKFAPVGYRKTRAGRLKLDPITAPLVTEVYRLRARGESVRRCCAYLEQHGVLTAGRRNPGWTDSTLSHMLRSRVYLGEVFYGPHVHPGAHEALIDPATWEAAHYPPNLPRHDPIPGVLVGLVRCASCRRSMTASIARVPGRPDYLNYRCRKFSATGTCSAPAHIAAKRIEPFVIDAMFRMLRKRRRTPTAELESAAYRAAAAAEALNRYRDNDRIAERIGDISFLEGLDVRQERAFAPAPPSTSFQPSMISGTHGTR
jgi:DNA invertase Pin-like site-specific DNA recombinase